MSDLGLFYGRMPAMCWSCTSTISTTQFGWGQMAAILAEFQRAAGIEWSYSGCGHSAAPAANLEKVVAAATLAQAIREYGHLDADIDPLGRPVADNPDLEPLPTADRKRFACASSMVVGGQVAEGSANAADAMQKLRAIYTGSIGYDFDHVHLPVERAWLTRRRIPTVQATAERSARRRSSAAHRCRSLRALPASDLSGQKRFSIEGTDMWCRAG